MISSVLNQDGVQVVIGEEWHKGGMSSFSVVLARYGLENQMAGVLGVIGPTRMRYSRAIAVVDGAAQAVSRVLREN